MMPSHTGGAHRHQPLRAEYHGRLAFALFHARDWREAAKESRAPSASVRPTSWHRELLIRCELRLKDHGAALKEFQTLVSNSIRPTEMN